MIAQLIFYLVLLFYTVDCAVDITVQPETNGSSVVQASIDKISQSAIFSINDQQMLRRIAFVETRDGTSMSTYSSDTNHGGIWQVSEPKYLATKETGSNAQLAQQVMKIEQQFKIKWLNTKWSDLRRPFYSALAARLYMQVITQSIPLEIPLASDVTNQASYWSLQFTSSRKPPTDYVNAVTELQALENCTVSSLDLFFIMDASGSVGSVNFQTMKSFVHNVVDSFDVASDKVRVGVMSYASSNSFHFHLNTYLSKSSLLLAIDNLPYSGGGTNTAGALDGARIFGFTESNGTRPRSQGVPRVAIVITDGRSNSFPNTVTAAMALHDAGIIAFALGIQGANVAELDEIASQPSYVSFIGSFDEKQLDALQISISQESCVASPPLAVNDTISDTIGEGEAKYFNYQLNETGITLKINVSNGSTTVYGSTTISTPSDAFYDFKIDTNTTNNIFLDPKIFSKQGGLVTIYIAIIGTSQSNNFTINTDDGDTSTNPVEVFSSHIESIVKEEGEIINISCIATGKPRPEIIWFKNQVLITDDRIDLQTRYINNDTATESVMLISSSVSSDDGVYTCRGANVIPNRGLFNKSISFTICVITVNTSHLPFLNMSVRAGILNNVLDHSVKILTPQIYFAGRPYNRLYIGSHGTISFGEPFADYIPRLFPITVPVIAPFWDDSDLRGSGYVQFDVINKYADSLNIINDTKNFLKIYERVIVDPTWVLVARWINVCPFQNRYCNNPRIEPNTVQLVLVSQGMTSYAVFTYKCGQFEWTDHGATVGYSANSNFYYNHPSSGKASITSIDCHGSPQSEWTNFVFNINI